MQLMKNSTGFRAYLTNPTISRGDKVKIIDKAFDAKSKTSAVTKNLLLTMAANARLRDADKVRERKFRPADRCKRAVHLMRWKTY